MIDLAKKYKTTWGVPVILHEIVGDFAFGRTETLIPGAWRENELVETSPWDHIKSGDPVRVRFSFWDEWCYGIFSGVKENRPTTFGHGGAPQFWDICEKISIEDLP